MAGVLQGVSTLFKRWVFNPLQACPHVMGEARKVEWRKKIALSPLGVKTHIV